jgi:CDP-diacylglycerol--serine O-phosphatidyltransferase
MMTPPSDRYSFDDTPEFAPRRRSVGRIGISLLPSAATLGNLLCGFLAVMCCLLEIRGQYLAGAAAPPHPILEAYFPTYINVGAWLIVVAMLFDAMDGRLARITRQTSEFGAQLDSLADVVSFGAAPAMLFLTMLLRYAVPAEGDPIVRTLQWRLSLLAALAYVSCAAIRLARYNAENIKGESAQQSFKGLPVPGAAAAFVALLVLHEDWTHVSETERAVLGVFSWLTAMNWGAIVRWVMIPSVFGLGLLMVSRFDYVHVFNVYVAREHPPTHLIWILLLLGIAWLSPELALVLVAGAYVVSGLVRALRRRRDDGGRSLGSSPHIHQSES